MVEHKGIIAAGHEETARAAESILRAGGNAFDAIVAAHCTACVAEPVLTSLGGGGFLLAHTSESKDMVYDFFVQTPACKRPPTELDFHPICADFGTEQQEFHIGLGTIAVPGAVKGLFAIHRDLCTLPMTRLMEPAIELARNGVRVNAFQALFFRIIGAIFTATPESRSIFGSRRDAGRLVGEGEWLRQPQLADTLDALAREGQALFYRGEIAHRISTACASGGGQLEMDDLAAYRVHRRVPLAFNYRDTKVLSNPPPSSGGILIAFAMKLLEDLALGRQAFGSAGHLEILAKVMALTNKARLDAHLDVGLHPDSTRLLDPAFLALYRRQVAGHANAPRGTTHISVMDVMGNIASLSISNGEGCGHIVPGTGVMLNNMLGEEDLNPGGFHRWPADRRMTSMMAPTLFFTPQGRSLALGSGGSNRIRTAILQVMINLIDYAMSLREAVERPRIHYEQDLLSIEGGFERDQVQKLIASYPMHKIWDERNVFFGGTHCVMRDGGQFHGAGDPRRGGVAIIA